MPSFGDPELQTAHFLCPSEDQFAATTVFPLIHSLKEDVIVRDLRSLNNPSKFT